MKSGPKSWPSLPTARWRPGPAFPHRLPGPDQATPGRPGHQPQPGLHARGPGSLAGARHLRAGGSFSHARPRRSWGSRLPAIHSATPTGGLLRAPGAGHQDGAARLAPAPPPPGLQTKGQPPLPRLSPPSPPPSLPSGRPSVTSSPLQAARGRHRGASHLGARAGGLPAHSRSDPPGPGPAPSPLNRFCGPPAPSRPAPRPHPAEHVRPGWGLGPLPPGRPTPTGNIPETFLRAGGRPRPAPRLHAAQGFPGAPSAARGPREEGAGREGRKT